MVFAPCLEEIDRVFFETQVKITPTLRPPGLELVG